MSDKNISCAAPAAGEPTAARSTAPIWIIVTTLILLFLGGYYFDRHGGGFDPKVYSPYSSTEALGAYQPQSGAAAALLRGKRAYDAVCGICHESPKRATMVPDLHNIKTATNVDFWHTWIAHGKAGSLMPAFSNADGGTLSDMQIASLVQYLSAAFPSQQPANQ